MAEHGAADGPSISSTLPPPPQLFLLEPIDVVDQWQQELVDCYHSLKALTIGKSQMELHDALQQKASESMRSHSELVNGLVYGILTEPNECGQYFRNLNLVSRDGFAHAISRLQLLATAQKFGRLRPEVRTQLIWFVGELIKINAQGVDQVLIFLSRQMRSGDVTQSNVKLCRMVLSLLESSYEWLVNYPVLVATTVYAYGRLVLDHSRIPDLCKQESEFVVRLLRAKFTECSMIGRDLVRVLQDVAKLPAFRDLWRDIVHYPQSIGPHFTGIEQLLRAPTPKAFLANRLTFDMEAKLLFILERLPFNAYSRNITWFAQRYLNTPESESLYCDLIRYICGVFHPSNAVLASNIVPRYVLLGSILRFIRSQPVAANAKLALFYDWFFYDPQVDNIMNVEPGVLIMARSLDRYTYLTQTFIEFLAFVSDAYFPTLAQSIRRSVGLTMRDAVEKGVVPSLVPIFEHPKIDANTKRYMQQLFSHLLPSLSATAADSDNDGEQDGSASAGAGGRGDDDEVLDTEEPMSFDYDASMDTGESTQSQSMVEPLTLNRQATAPQLQTDGPAVAQPQLQRSATMLPGLSTINKPAVTIQAEPLVIAATAAAAPSAPTAIATAATATVLGEPKPSYAPVNVNRTSLDPVSRMFAEDYGIEDDEISTADVAMDISATIEAAASEQEGEEEDSADPDDIPLVADGIAETDGQAEESTSKEDTESFDDPSLWLFGSSLKDFAANMSSGDTDSAAEAVREIVTVFAQSEAPTKAVASILSSALADVELEDVETNAELIEAGDEESVEHDMVHHIFASMVQHMSSDPVDTSRDRLLDLLVQLTESIVDVGFRWLLFCIYEANQPSLYLQYVGRYKSGTVQAALSRDMHSLQERFNGLFYSVLPGVYKAFSSYLPGCKAVVKSVVALIDQPQVYHLNMLVATGQLVLFGGRAAKVIGSTMEYDAFEQVCLWQLLSAEVAGNPLTIRQIASHLLIGKRLDPEANSEAANGLLAVLRTIPPSAELLAVLAKYAATSGDSDSKEAKFCGSVLTSWLLVWHDALLKLIPALLAAEGLYDTGAKMITSWTALFSTRFGPRSLTICADIKEACKRPVASAVEEQAADDSENRGDSTKAAAAKPKKDEATKSDKQPKTTNKRARRSTDSRTTRSKAASKRAKRGTHNMAKRRRRNVITSDDEEDAGSSSENSEADVDKVTDDDGSDNGGGGGDESLSDLSSVASISSLSSPSSNDSEDSDDADDDEF
ncbi:hypothetical protein GGI12_003059 [Dipsacomyces acuminosporus]|nr:hypothetical protein GGI12_003059 [Dipsacomyces acuminosporus]